MQSKLDELIGQRIYGCDWFSTRLDLNCGTFSICHEAVPGNGMLGKIEELSPVFFEDRLLQLAVKNRDENSACRKCTKCKEFDFEPRKISYVTVNTSNYCNSCCIYCKSHFGEENTGYNPIPYLEDFYKAGFFESNCWFDWGGGEPTLNPYFEEAVQWIREHGFYQRINTNAIIYSKEVESALKQQKACLRISVDSGTEKTFRIMKGHDAYEQVWENIGKYCDATKEVYIKYNVCNYNSDVEEITAFLDRCSEHNVRNVIIDAEINSYQPNLNCGPFYFTQKELDAAHLLETEAKKRGFCVQISSYAYSVRAEYDETGNLILPTKYYDNIDKDNISSGIYVKTFPNLKYMMKDFLEDSKEIAIWGMGHFGQKAYQLLKDNGVEVTAIIDQSTELQRTGYCGKRVISPEEFFENNVPMTVLLVGNYWKDMLALINKNEYNVGEIVYMSNVYYSYMK